MSDERLLARGSIHSPAVRLGLTTNSAERFPIHVAALAQLVHAHTDPAPTPPQPPPEDGPESAWGASRGVRIAEDPVLRGSGDA